MLPEPEVAVTNHIPISAAEAFAHEIRRISSMILSSKADSAMARLAPGQLALRIASSFGLRAIDVDIALAVLAAHIDHEFALMLHNLVGRSELGLLAALLPKLEDRLALSDAVGAESPTVAAKLLRRTETDGAGLLAPTRRFTAAVLGKHLLSMLPSYAEVISDDPVGAPWVPSPHGLVSALQREGAGALCLVTGMPGAGKTTWACSAAYSLKHIALRIDAAGAARSSRAVSAELRELMEDAALEGVPIVLDNAGTLLQHESTLSTLLEDVLISAPAKLFVVLGTSESLDERVASRALARVCVQPPPPEVRHELWSRAKSGSPIPSALAQDLVLTPRQIRNAIALVESGVDPVAAAFEQLPQSHGLTLPDRTQARLRALVLPKEVRAEIIELIEAIRARCSVVHGGSSNRGRALTAMFNGDSGTGKTFACEVIAAEVGLPLMRVNVASLVDKYIGETEKNLVRVFEQAQGRGGILFFDEADAIFSTRTDVSRATDRYANLETNLLLQLMEQFTGVVLLTTNLKQNIDQAFMRRITFKIYFDPPEAPERAKLWRSILPLDRYEEGIDYVRLARAFELNGGSIRAASLRAAYRATAGNRRITLDDLAECAQLETQGMGRVAAWEK